jgi:hypothetical protein
MNRRSLGVGCMVLFSLPFAAVGVGMAIWLAFSIHAYLKTQSWVEVPAQILHVELVAHAGDDGCTYETTAQYQYVYQKETYQGSRVGIESGSDNLGSFQESCYRELKEFEQNKKAFRCFVNPDRPQQSILYRELRWEVIFFKMAFVAGFGSAGFGMFAGAIAFRNRPPAFKAAETPWLARPDWASGRVVHSDRAKAAIVIVVAVVCSAAAVPAWMTIGGLLSWPGGVANVVIAAIGAGVLLIDARVFTAVRGWRRNDSVFQLAAVPGVIGGQLAGAIELKMPARTDDGFRLTLNCIHRFTKGSGDSQSIIEDIRWHTAQTTSVNRDETASGKSVVPVCFDIPSGCPPTDATNPSDGIVWRLEIISEKGGGFRARFEVPVFQMFEGRLKSAEPHFAPGAAASGDPQAALGEAGVTCAAAPDGESLQFVFPSRRNWGKAAVMTIVAAILVALAWGLWQGGVPRLFAGFFAVMAVPAWMVTLDLWLYQGMIEVSLTHVVVRSGWPGIARRRELPIGEVLKIEAVHGMTVNTDIYYDLMLVTVGGRKITFAKRIRSGWTAQGVIRAIEQGMGRGA